MSKPYKVISTIKSTEVAIYDENGELVEEWQNEDGMLYDERLEELTEQEMEDYFPDWEE